MRAASPSPPSLRRSYQLLVRGLVPGLILAATASVEYLNLWYRQPAIQWVEAPPIGNGAYQLDSDLNQMGSL